MAALDFTWTASITTRFSQPREKASSVESGPPEVLILDQEMDRRYEVVFKAVDAATANAIKSHFEAAKTSLTPFRWTAAASFLNKQPLVIYDFERGWSETRVAGGLFRVEIRFVEWG